MRHKFNLYLIFGVVFLAAFCILIFLLTLDTAVIAPSGEAVGLSHINNLVKYNENKTLDKISDVLLYLSFSAVALGIGLGIYQLVKEKNLKKVDLDIIIFGVFVVISVILWILFDKLVKINVRPIDPNEGSFPSTHIFVTTFFMLALHYLLCKLFDNKLIKYGSLALAILFIVLVTIFRVAAGMHYITDAIGGLFIGLSFYFLSFGIAKNFMIPEK